ncbi:cytochrome P450 [Ilyonectria destructans]|nr:cytochrome P450 [Ilyonectria destructans]
MLSFGVPQLVILTALGLFLARRSLLSLRAFLSPIPGPLLAKLTVWYLRYYELRGERELFIERLHKKYGDIVYVAPTEVAVRSANGLRDVFSANKLDKPNIILLEQWGVTNVASTRDAALHMARRKIVAPVYTAPAIASPPRQKVFKQLVEGLRRQMDLEASQHDGLVDIYPLLRWLAADIMSHIIFGTNEALNSLENRSQQKMLSFTLPPIEKRASQLPVILMGWYPNVMRWLMSLGLIQTVLRGMGDGESDLQDLTLKIYNSQLEKPAEHDVPTHMDLLMKKYRENGLSAAIPKPMYIASDSIDHFTAGCFTSADTSSWLIWEMGLPHNRDQQLMLRQELHDAGIGPGVEAELSVVNKLPFLDAALKETLRAHPPVAFSQTRQIKPNQDVRVLGHKIYPGVKVGAQFYSVHRHPDVFPDAEKWDPSRWEGSHDTPEYRDRSRHFGAFGTGQRICIGMHIAWAEVRLVAAAVFSSYDVKLPSTWFDEKGQLLPTKQRQHLFPFHHEQPVIFTKLT